MADSHSRHGSADDSSLSRSAKQVRNPQPERVCNLPHPFRAAYVGCAARPTRQENASPVPGDHQTRVAIRVCRTLRSNRLASSRVAIRAHPTASRQNCVYHAVEGMLRVERMRGLARWFKHRCVDSHVWWNVTLGWWRFWWSGRQLLTDAPPDDLHGGLVDLREAVDQILVRRLVEQRKPFHQEFRQRAGQRVGLVHHAATIQTPVANDGNAPPRPTLFGPRGRRYLASTSVSGRTQHPRQVALQRDFQLVAIGLKHDRLDQCSNRFRRARPTLFVLQRQT